MTEPSAAASRVCTNCDHGTDPKTLTTCNECEGTGLIAAFMTEPISCPPLTHYKSAEVCPDRAKHTSEPPGVLAWHEWAEKKAKTHTQHQCPTCGFWVIWKRKPKVAA